MQHRTRKPRVPLLGSSEEAEGMAAFDDAKVDFLDLGRKHVDQEKPTEAVDNKAGENEATWGSYTT